MYDGTNRKKHIGLENSAQKLKKECAHYIQASISSGDRPTEVSSEKLYKMMRKNKRTRYYFVTVR